MVFDRTIQDVKEAIRIRNEKVRNLEEITEQELAILEKGFFTINSINRIEQAQAEIKSLINEMGYWGETIENKTWQTADVFNVSDLQRLFDNTQKLKDAFFSFRNTPKVPLAKYHFENINAIEKILHDLETMVGVVKENYRFCGALECGEI